jgi:hypothetical protein
MTVRRPLQRQIFDAWRRSIDEDYCNQRINSERSLQASFWSRLNQILPAETRRMFIEPRLTLTIKGRKQRLYPDIVICNTNQAIAVIEIKYQPRIPPTYDKDIDSLRMIAANRRKLFVSNTRFRGPASDPKEYGFAEPVLFVWAGVHRQPNVSHNSPDVPLFSRSAKKLAGCFLELHAETTSAEKPHVFKRTG